MINALVRSEQMMTLPPPYLLVIALERAAGFDMGMHLHDFFQTIYVTSGTLDIQLRGETHVLSAGQAAILRPGVPHALFSSHGYGQIGIDIADKEDERGIRPLFSAAFTQECTILAVPGAPIQFDAMFKRLRNRTALDTLIVTSMAEGMILHILENSLCKTHRTFRERFLSMMAEEHSFLLGLEEMCRRMRMSKTNLENMMQAEFGCGAVEYCNKIKLDRARMFLQSTDLPIRVISEMLHFYDESHFNSFFKKRMQITPGRYRKNIFILYDHPDSLTTLKKEDAG